MITDVKDLGLVELKELHDTLLSITGVGNKDADVAAPIPAEEFAALRANLLTKQVSFVGSAESIKISFHDRNGTLTFVPQEGEEG